MNFDFTEDQRTIKATARELLASRSPFANVRAAAEEGRYDEALWRELCELGWPGIAVAEQHGGQGLGAVELAVLLEELGADALTTGNRWAYELLRSRGNTIEGGTTEILKNIVAERVLGLPRAGR